MSAKASSAVIGKVASMAKLSVAVTGGAAGHGGGGQTDMDMDQGPSRSSKAQYGARRR